MVHAEADEDAYPLALAGLPHFDFEHVFIDLGAVRSGGSSDQIQIECRFLTTRDPGARIVQTAEQSYWLPITDLPFLVPFMRYVRRRPVGLFIRGERRRLTGWRPEEICGLTDYGPITRQTDLTPANGQALTVRRLDRPYLFDRNQRIFLQTSELFRFYFGGISRLCEKLLSAYDIESPEAGILRDADRTFLDAEAGTFHIAPTWEFADQGSALQLATILASEDLGNAWRAARQSLIAGRFSGHPSHVVCWLGERPPTLSTLGSRFKFIDTEGREQSAYRVDRIVADFRQAPFREIVVHVDRSAAPVSEDEEAMELLQRGAKWKNLTLDSRVPPGGRTIRMSGNASTLLKAFPNFDNVVVRYEFDSPQRQSRQIDPEKPTYILGSTAEPAVGQPHVARVVTRPTKGAATRTARIGEELLFTDVDFERPAAVQVAVRDLAYPLRQFVNASLELSRRGHGHLLDPQPAPGEVYLWRLPETWPRWEHQRPMHPVFAAVTAIKINGSAALAIELGRHKPALGTSIGLFASPSGLPFGPMHAAIILRHAVSRRSSRCDWDRGYWPTERRFADVIHRPVRHLKQRRSAEILADVLGDAVEGMTQLAEEH